VDEYKKLDAYQVNIPRYSIASVMECYLTDENLIVPLFLPGVATVQDQDATYYQVSERDFSSEKSAFKEWEPNKGYTFMDVVCAAAASKKGRNCYYILTNKGGVSSAYHPAWTERVGDLIYDDTLRWRCCNRIPMDEDIETYRKTFGSAFRVDLLSYAHYGTVNYYWVILHANGLTSAEQIKPGATLMLPSRSIILDKWL
jgi:hypothetical protein